MQLSAFTSKFKVLKNTYNISLEMQFFELALGFIVYLDNYAKCWASLIALKFNDGVYVWRSSLIFEQDFKMFSFWGLIF